MLSWLFGLPWLELAEELVRMAWAWWRRRQDTGMYEALRYESTLELLDAAGEEASFTKRARVRYLQNDVVAFQDQIWSDGRAPIHYRCSPGVVVDRYRRAQTTVLLISLRQAKQRGEADDYHIQWRIRGGFRRSRELWQTTIYYQTRFACIQVIFPAARPPQEIWGREEFSRRALDPARLSKQQLPDGRWLVQWKVRAPALHERYNLHWLW